MAENVMFNVSPNFDVDVFAKRLADTYKSKGFNVTVANIGEQCTMSFEKGIGGINMLLGLGVSVKAVITKIDNAISISFSDAEWTSKIIGLVVGWFLCLIPFITAIVGAVNQLSLPKDIGKDAQTIASSM